jgi:hypothetical protein
MVVVVSFEKRLSAIMDLEQSYNGVSLSSSDERFFWGQFGTNELLRSDKLIYSWIIADEYAVFGQ